MNNATRTLIAMLAFLSLHNAVAAQDPMVAMVATPVAETVQADVTAADTRTPAESTIAADPALPANVGIPASTLHRETAESRTGITVFGATPESQDRLDWAVSRFATAGLELPYLEIYFFEGREACDGYEGTFRHNETPLRIDVCNNNKLIIIHELAHAWDKHNLDSAGRDAFMELRGLHTWNSASVPWNQLGVEDLAEVVVWGLLDYGSGYGAATASKLESFELVTGVSPPRRPQLQTTRVATEPMANDYS